MYLKKTLEMIGLSILICFSFIFTEKTTNVMKENDSIMTLVKENKDILEIPSINAKINEDEIVPGISGRVVDIEKSYQAMKKVGYYNESLFVYKKELPTVSIKDNYDKYIVSGNKSKKQVSIIFKIDKEQNIDNIVDLLDKNKMNANIFISYDWVSNNINKIKNLSNKNYVFGALNETNNVDNDNFKLLQTLIKINSSQTNYYCYTEEKSSDLLSICSKDKHYTILPSITIENNLLADLMKNISPGSIISISINKNTASELSNALEYITSRGYRVVNLDKLLEE